ncbi:hypothetical protein [Virgibacillus salexigens]|uniref:Uncharacterized protein n=1 Tax=Virgibacillus massiliensis TaxID=1462526 RepID=A0A024QH34_9BACI|nr:hypothetical protein [Virgibacillus massiliensis]CDQ41475.1 hypothetical protein BN990_03848 [Virgibacillus massiliensis]
MKLENHFLQADISKASEEFYRSLGLLSSIMNHVNEGNLSKAKHLSTDLTMSLHKMEKMSSDKYNADQFHSVIQDLVNSGASFQIVRDKLYG